MKYMVLISSNVKAWGEMSSWSNDDVKVMVDYMEKLNQELTESGELVDAHGLGGPAFAKIVTSDGRSAPVVTDGPFSEAKEFLAGYWTIDVHSEERAIEIAARASACPGPGGAAGKTPIELHPVLDAPVTG
jgi:hypothetical protein